LEKREKYALKKITGLDVLKRGFYMYPEPQTLTDFSISAKT